jgi:hypothetical protein
MAYEPENPTTEALRRFESGQSDFEEIMDDRGVRSFMIRDPDDPRFFRIESENPHGGFSVSATGMRLPPSPHRPRELPKHLPFVPEATTVVMIVPATGSVVARWESPREPMEAFREVRAASRQEGWEEEPGSSEEQEEGGAGSRTRLELRKNGAVRTLTLLQDECRWELVLTEDRMGG